MGNALRITPELFEISSQKACELRALEKLSVDDKQKRRGSHTSSQYPNSLRPNSLELSPTSKQPICSSTREPISHTVQSDHRSYKTPQSSNNQTPDPQTLDSHDRDKRIGTPCSNRTRPSSDSTDCDSQEDLIRASLVEILKNRNRGNNREASLGCIGPDVPR